MAMVRFKVIGFGQGLQQSVAVRATHPQIQGAPLLCPKHAGCPVSKMDAGVPDQAIESLSG